MESKALELLKLPDANLEALAEAGRKKQAEARFVGWSGKNDE